MPDSTDRPLSIREASRILQRSTKSLRNYVKAGRLTAEKVPGPKGPQFVFHAAEVERLAQEQRLDVAEHVVPASRDAGGIPGTALQGQMPASVPALIEAFLVSERERTLLLREVAESREKTGHAIGVLEERVSQLQQRLKREAAFAERSKDLEKEVRLLKKRAEDREEDLRRAEARRRAAERRRWWHGLWRKRETWSDEG